MRESTSPQPSDWPKAFSRASRSAVFLVGLVYAIGLIIVNLDLAQHGLVVLDLIRTEYILAGALWVALTAVGLGLYRALGAAIRQHWSTPGSTPRRLWFVIGEILAAWALSSYVLTVLSGGVLQLSPEGPTGWTVYVVALQVGLQLAFTLFLNILMIQHFMRRGPAGLANPHIAWMTGMVLVSFVVYSLSVYPWLAKGFGGGQKVAVQVILHDAIDIPWKEHGIDVSPDGKRVGPAVLILETDRRLFISRPIAMARGFLRPTLKYGQPIGVDQKQVLAVVYLPRTELKSVPGSMK